MADEWTACPPSTPAAASGGDALERAFTERFFDPTANLVEIDADDPKRVRILLAERHGVTLAGNPHDLRSHIVETDPEPVKRLVPDTRAIAQKPQQEVLGIDVVVMQVAGFLLSEDDRSPSSLRETLEHHQLPPGKEPPTRVFLVDRLLAHVELLGDLLP